MLQLTSLTQKISLLLVLSLLSTLMPGPAAIPGTARTVPTDAFTSPLPTPTPQPQAATFTSPLPTPQAPAPILGLTVRAEPVGVAPGEIVTLTVTLDNPTGTTLTDVSVHATLPDALHSIPYQPGWAYDAPQKRLRADHLGSATLTTDASGNRVGELRYSPYGATRHQWGDTPTDRRYTGQRWDGALSLYDYRARYYDPLLGRFISAGTVVPEPGRPQALNRYGYVLNNPLRLIDHTGHCSEDAILTHLKRTYSEDWEGKLSRMAGQPVVANFT